VEIGRPNAAKYYLTFSDEKYRFLGRIIPSFWAIIPLWYLVRDNPGHLRARIGGAGPWPMMPPGMALPGEDIGEGGRWVRYWEGGAGGIEEGRRSFMGLFSLIHYSGGVMLEIKEFEIMTRDIFHLITEYGYESITAECGVINRDQLQQEGMKEKFLIKCHEGWKLGQEKIVNELIRNLDSKEKFRNLINQTNDKLEIKKIQQQLDSLKYQELILRKLADSIAWQIFHMEEPIVKRFMINEDSPIIQPNNLLREKKVIDEFNKTHPLAFSLLCDITSFIQIGDAITIDFSKSVRTITIVELKNGKMNSILRYVLDQYPVECNDEDFLKMVHAEFGKKVVSQIKRMKSQDVRMNRVIQVINTGKGIDPIGDPIRIPDKIHLMDNFDEKIQELLTNATVKKFSLDIIDNCLYVGAYSNKFPYPEYAFELMMIGYGNLYPITDFRSTLSHPVAMPPFLLPLEKEEIFDLLFHRKQLLFCLDYNKWFESCKIEGVSVHWSTTKSAEKMKQNSKPIHRPYLYKNQMIEIDANHRQMFLGAGLLIRIFFNFCSPKTVLNMYAMIEYNDDEKPYSSS